MRKRIGLMVLMSALAGCASSQEIEQNARAHDARAAALEARGDFHQAAKERQSAQKQHRKAMERAQRETYVF
jgi:outer membrane murein-binding lipoprotein Lpp